MKELFRRATLVATLFVVVTAAARGAERQAQYSSYDEMREEVGGLWNEERFADAATILERAVDAYPERLRPNTVNLALMRVKLDDLEGALDALDMGLSKGTWYGKYDFFGEIWAPMKALPRFAEIERRCEARRAEAQKLVEPRLDVVVPPEVSAGERLPLFIALHGGGENVDLFRPHWMSPLLGREFVVAYPQSTQLIAPDGFDWMQDVAVTLAELKRVYEKLIREYPVDPERVVIGGFSSGGAAALEVVLSNALPVAGFVSLCPAKPDDFDVQRVQAAVERGVRGTLLTTERDGRIEAQKEMAAVMKEAGLLVDFVVTPDIGHWYPPDLGERIDAALRAVVSLDEPAGDGSRAEPTGHEWSPPDAPDFQVTSHGLDIHYQIFGRGTPLLVLGGGPGDVSGRYVSLCELLAARDIQCILVEQRGTGRSTPSVLDASTLSIALTLDDFEAIRRQRDLKQWSVLGFSYGGYLASLYAHFFPESVSELVLLDSMGLNWNGFPQFTDNVTSRLWPSDRQLLEYWSAPERMEADPQRAITETIRAKMPGYFFDRQKSLLVSQSIKPSDFNFEMGDVIYEDTVARKLDLSGMTSRFDGKVLILHGRQDPVGESIAIGLERYYEQSRLVFVEKCGHYSWIEQPEEILAAVGEFLSPASEP